MKNNKKIWFFKKKGFTLNSLEFESNAVKLSSDTFLKLKNVELETWWISLSTYDDKINHLIWFYNNYRMIYLLKKLFFD